MDGIFLKIFNLTTRVPNNFRKKISLIENHIILQLNILLIEVHIQQYYYIRFSQ